MEGVVRGITITVAARRAWRRRARRPARGCPRRRRSTPRDLVGLRARHLVVGAAQLEREDRLEILALEQDRPAEPLRQARHRIEGLSIATS
jgi:hypothetical protein